MGVSLPACVLLFMCTLFCLQHAAALASELAVAACSAAVFLLYWQ